MDRRELLKGAMTGALTLWAIPLARGAQQPQQAAAANGVRRLNDKLFVVDGGGTNVVALSGGDGLFLVDSGVPGNGDKLAADLEYVPLPDAVKALVHKQWADVKDGAGKPVAYK